MSSLDLDRTSDSSTEPIYSPDFADMAMSLAQQDSFPPSHFSGQLFPASETESNFAAASSVEDLQINDLAGSIENTSFICSRGFSEAGRNEAYRKWKQAADLRRPDPDEASEIL